MNTRVNRWILYIHHPMGGFEVKRVTSVGRARAELEEYDRAARTDNQATASLYPYSEDDWESAVEFLDVGCPFDYPAKRMWFGPRGAVVTTDA